MIAVGAEFAIDRPDNRCFGCSPHVHSGLRMRFTRLDERRVESRYTFDPVYIGMQDVVHGGIQAALLDEVMSVAATMDFERGGPDYAVTVELSLRYRRPVPIGAPLVIRGERTGEDEREIHLVGTIFDATGERLTLATGKWRKLRRPD